MYLGVPWEDLLDTVDWEEATFESVIEALKREISIKYPVVRRRIKLFSLPDQTPNEGPWEYWRRVSQRCKEGAIGSRTTGLNLNFDQFCITLFSKGLKEADRSRVHKHFLNYDCTYEQIEELARSLEQKQNLEVFSTEIKGDDQRHPIKEALREM